MFHSLIKSQKNLSQHRSDILLIHLICSLCYLTYSITQSYITIMRIVLRQDSIQQKQCSITNTRPIKKPIYQTEQDIHDDNIAEQQHEETFNLTLNEKSTLQQTEARKIKRSVINRSCINTWNESCKGLTEIPKELNKNLGPKLSGLQKLDLSFNNICDIHQICFEEMISLKELILNDNKISQLPFSQINKCKGLKLLNINSNQIYLLPAFTRISFLEVLHNPLKLITTQLINLSSLQFITFDWLEYLIDIQSHQTQDKYKLYASQYNIFKKNILQKIDYQDEHNSHYCDFHCYFSVRYTHKSKQDIQLNFLSLLIVKSIHKNDDFFISYLYNFQNELNYAKLTYNCKLLLQTALQGNNEDILQLFRMKKPNYTQEVSQQVYFQSLRLSCRYSNYIMFKYLLQMRKRRKKIQTKSHLSILIQQLLERFVKEKGSDKMIIQLMEIYIEVTNFPISIKIPHQFNSKLFKSLSLALLQIYQHEQLVSRFKIQFQKGKTTPLHFAMKSRNEQLLKQLLKQEWSVFQRNHSGTSCKFTHGSTQISRKMVWKRQKQMIKQHFASNKSYNFSSITQKMPQQPFASLNQSIKRRIGYPSLQPSFLLYKYPKQSLIIPSKQQLDSSFNRKHRKHEIKETVLSHVLTRAKQLSGLSWRNNYLKRIVGIDIFIFLLQKLVSQKQPHMMKKMQIWSATMDGLVEAFDTIGDQNQLLQYQIVHATQWANGMREDLDINQIQIESKKNIVQSNSFWCCQNVTYD